AASEAVMSELREQFRMEEPAPEKDGLLGQLLGGAGDQQAILDALAQRYGISLYGPHYSIIIVSLNLPSGIRKQQLLPKDSELLQYAALNIINELMGEEWNHVIFSSDDQEVTVMIQWDGKKAEEINVDKINQLDMIGRSLHFNLHKYLRLSCVVGISQILKGTEFLTTLKEQARRALLRHADHPDHYVFYYGDFDWSRYAAQEPTADELNAQNNVIVDRAKSYIDHNYAQKGLTLHEVAQRNHVSPNYLSYLFKKKTGFNLWEYVIKLRMEESRRLLTTTDLRRYEISEQVGYESPEHFSKIFKKYFGMSPSELKK
ncbi:AraC family transcriptional regulator, partial [Paenibacillus sepulcri]|nr:AraC family transcriptional regulator [Paenibacillus sepulcri]